MKSGADHRFEFAIYTNRKAMTKGYEATLKGKDTHTHANGQKGWSLKPVKPVKKTMKNEKRVETNCVCQRAMCGQRVCNSERHCTHSHEKHHKMVNCLWKQMFAFYL